MIREKKLILLFMLLAIYLHKVSSQNVCNTKVCHEEAEKIRQNMDSTVEPCEDFFQYACGNYKPEIPNDKAEVNIFSILQDLLNGQLNVTMNERISENDSHHVKIVKSFYKNCMDVESINNIGTKHVEEKMKYLGGWPSLKSHKWNEKTWTYQKFIQTVELVGFSQNYIVGYGVIQDLKNDTNRIILVDQPSLGLSREFLIKGPNDTLVQAYHSYQVDLAILYGAEREDAEKDMKDVLDFELALAKILQSKEQRRDITKLYNLITISELQLLFPCLNWLTYMNAFIQKEKHIDKNEMIMITSKEVFINIHKLLSSTPKRVIANYLMWRIALSTSSLLSETIRNRRIEYTMKLNGVKKYKPRWYECVVSTSSYISIATSALYVEKYFDQKSKHDALELVDNIKNQFKEALKLNDWMDEKTKIAALEKAGKMTNHIGYPDELKDQKKLSEYYEGLELEENKYFKSILLINRFSTKKEMMKFREPVNKTDWEDHSDVAIVNAFYSPSQNSIQFPAGILQGQMFSADRPKYMNYGSIGFVIGHEIIHGFDDQGRRFDGNGNLIDWWEKDTKQAYLKKAECIIHQYGNYTEPTTNKKLNGFITQGENIADNGGIIASYQAYQNYVRANGQELTLPNVELSPNQLFWMSAAQTWCGKTRPETMALRIETDSHSPPRFRINGVFSNSNRFLNDFKCSEKSMMNRKEKCKVW